MKRLDSDALALFARKGLDAGAAGPPAAELAPQLGELNAVKVRRVAQLTADLAGKPFDGLRILDLGCGEGVYAIEAALHGAEVLAVDVRTERMELGAQVASRHGLDGVEFRQQDVLAVSRESDGEFDVVYALGLLYHLDWPQMIELLERIRALCGRLLLVDTVVSLEGPEELTHAGRSYRGGRVREHEDDDPPELRRGRLLRSLENTFAVRLTRQSLAAAIGDSGFSSVLDCTVPVEPEKGEDRVTMAALAGDPVEIGTYPQVNG